MNRERGSRCSVRAGKRGSAWSSLFSAGLARRIEQSCFEVKNEMTDYLMSFGVTIETERRSSQESLDMILLKLLKFLCLSFRNQTAVTNLLHD